MKQISLAVGLLLTSSLFAPHAWSKSDKLVIGWQVPWALQGQLVQILKHTDILQQAGLKNEEVEFVGKTFGPELNELALAGSVDVILTGDQPAMNLFAKSKKWKAIARLMYNRTATYVPPASEIQNISQLKGKTVGLPVGAAAQRILEQELEQQKINPKKDLQEVNLTIQDQIPLIQRQKAKSAKWDQFDALSGFDPIPAILEDKGLARVIHVGKVCSLIVAQEEKIQTDRESLKKLLKAFELAYDYYRQNAEQANKWFVEEARLKDINDKALKLTTSLEPALNGEKPRLTFEPADLVLLQKAADYVEKATGAKISLKDVIAADFARP